MIGGIEAVMSEAVKWIGGTTVVAVVLLASAVIAGHALEAQDAPPVAAIEAPAPAPEPIAMPAPAPSPEPFVIKRILPIDGPIRYGEWHWNEEGVPAEGPLVITVDLEARVLSVFRDGYEIGAAGPGPAGAVSSTVKKSESAAGGVAGRCSHSTIAATAASPASVAAIGFHRSRSHPCAAPRSTGSGGRPTVASWFSAPSICCALR